MLLDEPTSCDHILPGISLRGGTLDQVYEVAGGNKGCCMPHNDKSMSAVWNGNGNRAVVKYLRARTMLTPAAALMIGALMRDMQSALH